MGMISAVRGVEAIEEAAALLRSIRFSANRPAYAEGELVAICVDPRWSDDNETIAVLITCFGLALQPVDWDKLRINIEETEGGHNITWLAFLDQRGQALRDGLPPGGEYSISLPTRVKAQMVGPVISNSRIRKRGAIQWNYEAEKMPSSIHTEDRAGIERIINEGRTPDASLIWRVGESEEGDVQVSFEADKGLAGRRLAITLIESRSGRVKNSGVLTLVPSRTGERCEGRLALGRSNEVKRPCDLVVEELPYDEI